MAKRSGPYKRYLEGDTGRIPRRTKSRWEKQCKEAGKLNEDNEDGHSSLQNVNNSEADHLSTEDDKSDASNCEDEDDEEENENSPTTSLLGTDIQENVNEADQQNTEDDMGNASNCEDKDDEEENENSPTTTLLGPDLQANDEDLSDSEGDMLDAARSEDENDVDSEDLECNASGENTSQLSMVTLDVDQQKQTVDGMKNMIKKLQAENKTLKKDIVDCQRYNRRWSLKVHGVKEEEGEDIRRKIIDILGNTAPKLRNNLEEGLDIVHRAGQWRQDGSSKSTIILFPLRRLRDAIWRETKGSKFLIDKKLRITEALSPEDKAAMEKLWPLV
uniref:serine/threonine-protein kinase rio2 n=1 Tax=Epinephelus lanceolatus TaxID=310571 RepID=UPI0014489961|nr:serine/threonine-protein kinase rio2 [Epinephelus lanceolatus]